MPAPGQQDACARNGIHSSSHPRKRHSRDIWAEVLHIERVGVQDNYSNWDADSCILFQIAARANKAGIKLAPAQFLKYRTIASLLAQMEKEKSDSTTPFRSFLFSVKNTN